MLPHRVVYWNIGPLHILIYPIAILAIALLIYGVRRHYLLWRLGQPENRFDRPWERLKGLVVYGLGSRRIVKENYPGVMHTLIYGGMVVLFIGTVTESADHYLRLSYLQGTVYLMFSLAMDGASLAIIAGLLLAAYRRYIQKPERLDTIPEDWITLALLAIIVISGLLVEGFRIAVNEVVAHPDWSVWSPLGYLLALAINGIGITGGAQLVLQRILWWIHMLLAQGWIAYIFYSKLAHIFIAPLNIYFRNLQPGFSSKLISDWETAETFGVAKMREFTWKQFLDMDACVRCGRCQDNCPAHLTGKPLSPKKLIQNLKAQMTDSLIEQKQDPGHEEALIIGNAVKEDELWACTTCGACQEMCPVHVEHINMMADVRRNLVMVESQVPEHFQAVLSNLERIGHPWAGTQYTRSDWMGELGLKPLKQNEQVDLLYWVGCTGALEGLSRKITCATAGLLRAAGVNFGLLGNEEICCGDAARRIGNEHLFQTMARQNIQVLKSHGVKHIITHCPHCFNVLKNEYPQLGGEFKVVHHSQFLAELVQQGRLRLNNAISKNVAIHDSCYLGRHNQIYQAPREILKNIPKIKLLEMKRFRERSFCCGGGGGHMWVEDKTGQRLNEFRIKQAEETGASVLATACPFCLQMFEAGIISLNLTNSLIVRDISELLMEVIIPASEPVRISADKAL